MLGFVYILDILKRVARFIGEKGLSGLKAVCKRLYRGLG